MKYIRAEDGIHRVFRLLKNGYFLVKISKYKYYHAEPSCKQANTIEELCDEFVVVYNHSHVILGLKQIKDAKNYNFNYTYIHGAIWTNKGLIYVAKMNEKGELELL